MTHLVRSVIVERSVLLFERELNVISGSQGSWIKCQSELKIGTNAMQKFKWDNAGINLDLFFCFYTYLFLCCRPSTRYTQVRI